MVVDPGERRLSVVTRENSAAASLRFTIVRHSPFTIIIIILVSCRASCSTNWDLYSVLICTIAEFVLRVAVRICPCGNTSTVTASHVSRIRFRLCLWITKLRTVQLLCKRLLLVPDHQLVTMLAPLQSRCHCLPFSHLLVGVLHHHVACVLS